MSAVRKDRPGARVALFAAGVTWLAAPMVGAAPPRAARVLAWLEAGDAQAGLGARLRELVGRFTDAVVRATSPDIAPERRRLWVLRLSDRTKCLLTSETRAHEPRWGRGGYILFLSENDSNGDGRIDLRDEHAGKLVPERGGATRQIGRGRSAAWSPDGRLVAILSDQGLAVFDLQGQPAAQAAQGRIILTDSALPEIARSAWAVHPRSGAIEAIEPALTRRLQWLGAVGADGKTLLFPNTQRTDLFAAPLGDPAAGRNLTHDEHLDMEPSWSPDQGRVVYVSNNPADSPMCPPG